MIQYKTPCYIIKKEKFTQNCNDIENNFLNCYGGNIAIGYSVKTNNCSQILRLVRERNWYAEVVSYEEYKLVKKAGFESRKIICNGPVKGKMLDIVATQKDVIVNLDNMEEVYKVRKLANGQRNFGIRINFDFETECPGQKDISNREFSRFGFNYENGEVERAIETLKESGIDIEGLHMHTSTKTRSLQVFETLAHKAIEIVQKYHLKVKYIDIGGGFFGGQIISEKPRMNQYAEIITNELKKGIDLKKTMLILEPGASVAATAVGYLTTVDNVRLVLDKRIVTVDGTLLHINPFMVERSPVMEVYCSGENRVKQQIICGATCMEKDVLGYLNEKKSLEIGDKILFKNAGAYTTSFNGNFILNKPRIYIEEKKFV